MSDSADLSAEAPRDRSIAARRAARVRKFERERLIVDCLNRGVSVAEIAGRIGVTEKRMRALVKEILARRMPEAPEEFAAVQMSRLNEALLVAYSAMSPDNLKAVALVVRIVRELDRYHGFVNAGRESADAAAGRAGPPVDAAAGRVGRAQRARLQASVRPETRPEMAPEAIERIESAPEKATLAQAAGAAPETGEAQSAQAGSHAVELADEASPLDAAAPRAGAELAPQATEKIDSALGDCGLASDVRRPPTDPARAAAI